MAENKFLKLFFPPGRFGPPNVDYSLEEHACGREQSAVSSEEIEIGVWVD